MQTELDEALGGGAWAVGAVVHGIGCVHDDEGRPVGERRAPSSAKKNVSMVLRPCPYADLRSGKPMNVSALAQMTRHLDAVLDDVAAFRAVSAPGDTTWEAMFAAVVDQLAGPAIHALRERSIVPARVAVGHKLAAGYFGVMRALFVARARGDCRPASIDDLMAFVAERGALIGASEVCAGPPNLIARATKVFLHGVVGTAPAIDTARAAIARRQCEQIHIGIAWELYDQVFERTLLVDGLLSTKALPRNDFFARRLRDRAAQIRDASTEAFLESACAAIPANLPAGRSERLRAAIIATPPEDDPTAELIEAVLAHGDGAASFSSAADRATLARRFSVLLTMYGELVAALFELEQLLRADIGVVVAAPMKLHAAILPRARSLEWCEAVLGHHIEATVSLRPEIALVNRHRRVALL